MSVSEDHCGLQKTIELVKGGANIPVTNENRLYYISSYSHYMMDQRTYTQTKQFVKGLNRVVPSDYFSYFFPDEL